jgi:hypothetical protein
MTYCFHCVSLDSFADNLGNIPDLHEMRWTMHVSMILLVGTWATTTHFITHLLKI